MASQSYVQKALYLSSLLFIFALTSCDSKRATYHDLKEMQEELITHSSRYTQDDWINFFEEFENLHRRMERFDYTPAERKEIGRIEGEMAAYFTKEVVRELKRETENFILEAAGFVEGFSQVFDNNK